MTALPHIGPGPRWVQGRSCSDWYIDAVALLAIEELRVSGWCSLLKMSQGYILLKEGRLSPCCVCIKLLIFTSLVDPKSLLDMVNTHYRGFPKYRYI